MRLILQFLLIVNFFMVFGSTLVSAYPLLVGFSKKEVKISTSFTGTNIQMFGSIDGEGEIVTVVRGYKRPEILHQKHRIAGIWVNGNSVMFNSVPTYHFVASSKALNLITSETTLRRLEIGAERITFSPAKNMGNDVLQSFRRGLITLRQKQGLFTKAPSKIKKNKTNLFRANIKFPSNVLTGDYVAETHLFRNGQRIATKKTKLVVQKVGIEAAIYNFAHQYAAIYGIVAVVIALFSGWFAAFIFRKV